MRLPSSVAMLGEGLDLKYESGGRETKISLRGLGMYSSVDGRTVWFWPLPKRNSRKSLDSYPRAAQLRETWSQLEADEVLTSDGQLGKKDVRLGRVTNIGYRSDKWSGKKQDYTHDTDQRVRPVLVVSGDVYRVSGGKLRVKPEGLTG